MTTASTTTFAEDWPTILDGADRGNAHNRVAKPVAAPNENSERLQLFRRQMFRHENATFIPREEEIGTRRFPTIVQPESIFRRGTRLLFDEFIGFGGDRFDGISGFINSFRKLQPPTAGRFSVGGSAEDGCSRAFRKERGQRSG